MGQRAAGGLAQDARPLSLRILFAADVPEDPNSGAAGTEYQTIQALRRRGHTVDTIWATDMTRRIQHGNLHYLLELPHEYRRVIAARTRHVDYDVIHVNQGHSFAAAREHRASKRKGVFVCRSHGLDDHMEKQLAPWRKRLGIGPRGIVRPWLANTLNQLLQRHDRLAYRYASGVLVSSSVDADYLVHEMAVPPQRVGCIAQAPAPIFCATPALPMSPQRLNRILHIGGFAYFKGVHAMAEAVSVLLSSQPHLQMTWVCRQEEHDQAQALLSNDVRDRVAFKAWVAQDKLVDILDQHGIFLMPSLFEGFGKLFLEAMARGLCVVGTAAGGMKDIIEHGRNGMRVGFHDAAGIVRVVQALQSSFSDATALSAAAAQTARQYSWDRMGAEVEAFYARLMALGPCSSGEGGLVGHA